MEEIRTANWSNTVSGVNGGVEFDQLFFTMSASALASKSASILSYFINSSHCDWFVINYNDSLLVQKFFSVFRIRGGEYIWILWGYPVSRSHEMVRRLIFIAQEIVHSSGRAGIETF